MTLDALYQETTIKALQRTHNAREAARLLVLA